MNGDYGQLPEGCPPPPIELPEEKNPCANGYEIGNVISNTIAKIITPKLQSDDPAINPILDTPQYQELERLKVELEQTPNSEDLHKQLEAAVKQYGIVAEEFANEKIQCFTQNVAEVKKIDIEFICADNAAHDSIKDALENSIFNHIKCGTHIDCEDLEKQLHGDMNGVAHTALGDIEGVYHNKDVSYREGVPDFNGNYQIPTEGEQYVFVSVHQGSVDTYRYMGSKNNRFQNKGNTCDYVADDAVVFEKSFGRYYFIKTKFGYARYEGANKAVSW